MKKQSKAVVITLSVVAVLVLLRALAPIAAEYYLNNRLLADLGDYTGYVEDVDLAVWRGAARVEGLHIDKKNDQNVEFVATSLIETSVSWRALSQGALRARIYIENPRVNFVDAEAAEDRQAGLGLDWRALTEDWMRFTIEEIEIRGGEVAFRNFTSDPPVDLRATNVQVKVSNLTNIEEAEGERVAEAAVSADVFNESPLTAQARFDPFEFDSFDFAADLQIRDLTRINPFAKAYANLDLVSGHGSIIMELEAEEGTLSGYAKPQLEDLEVADWEQDVEQQDDNVFRLMWESIAGMTDVLLSNPKSDKVATRIDISGDISDPGIGMVEAVFGVLRNAFIEAIGGEYEGITPFADREQTGGDSGDEQKPGSD